MASRTAHFAADHECERHGGIEVCARDGPEHGDENHQHGARREGIAEKRERFVAAGEPLAHDSGADDGREQECRAEGFCSELARQRHFAHRAGSGDVILLLPMSSSRRCRESLSSDDSGRLVKMPMR